MKEVMAVHFPLPWQLVLVLLVILVIFGASNLPEVGQTLGKGIRIFKKALFGKSE
jgi:sec-independent protein translocase protein TatA